MSIHLQSMSTVLSVSPEKTELLTVIKNEPEIVEIGINDILDSSDEDEEIIPDIKDIDIVSHELSEDLIKSETVSENTFENNHSRSVETQVFFKTENTPLTEKENITQSEYLYKTQDISDGYVSRDTSQGVIEVQGKEGSNEHFTVLRNDKQFVNFFKDSSDISRKAKCPNKTVFPECYKIVETTSCKKDRRKEKVIEVPAILYCCEKCMYTSGSSSNFKRHQLIHKTKPGIKDQLLKYRCDKCKYKTYMYTNLKVHKLNHLEPEQIPYFYCYHCSYKCKQKGSLKIHIFNHFEKKEVPFHCYICDFTTLKRNFIFEHFKKHSKHHSKCDETDYKNQVETYTKYCCDKCKYKTYLSDNLKIHKLKHLKPEESPYYTKYCCDKCKYKTYLSGNLKIHKLKHLKPEESPYFYCYHCPYKCKVKGNLKIHIFNHFKKQEVPFHCYICDFMTLKRNLIIEHFKKHPKHHSKFDETDYKNQVETYTKYCCDKCKYKTHMCSSLKIHKLKHLKPEEISYFYCYHCPYKCKVKGNLKIHIFNHFKKQEVPFHCYICDFTTLKRNLIIEHFKKHPKHHSKCDESDYKNQVETYNKYRCDKCKYKTYMCNSLKIHKLKHLKPEEIPYFYCYHCPYKCKQKCYLKIHIFNHFKKQEVPFHCYICDFTTLKRNLIIGHFKKHPKHHSKCDETDYKNQIETYTKKRMRYGCNKCNYRTDVRSHLKRHNLVHLKPEEIQYLSDLKNHIFRQHFKNVKQGKRLHCDKCNYKTDKTTHLKDHKLTHLKPEEIQYFYCYHCSYKAKRKGDLKKHIFSHFKKEQVKFDCYICNFVTTKRKSIIKHIKKHSKF